MNDVEQRLLGTKTTGFDADEDRGRSGLINECRCLLHRLVQNIFILVQAEVGCPRSRRAARLVYEVGRYLYVDGPGISKAGGQSLIDLALRLNGVCEHDGHLGHVPV